MTYRILCLDYCAIGNNTFLQIGLLIVRMALHLQCGRLNFRSGTYFLESFTFEIAKPDNAHFTLFDSTFHIPPGTHIIAYLLVKQQIDVPYIKTFQYFVDSSYCLTLTIFTRS